jgi:small-conductance mechanosensitive channel
MVGLEALLDKTYLGNTTLQWLIALAIAAGIFFILLLLRRLIRSHYKRLAATPQTELMEVPLSVGSRTTVLFILMCAVFLGVQAVELPAKFGKVLATAFTISAFWQAGLWITTAVLESLERKRRASMEIDRAVVGTLGIIGFIARVVIWSFVLLLTLDNLGIEIKPLLAGLGIGGLAVALAVQNILGDLLASLTIALDRPFVVGDSLSVDEFNGTVEYIGIKSTRLRSLSGEQIIIPNANLLSSRLRNNARMSERRAVFVISLSQETPTTKLANIPALIRSLIAAHKDTRFDRAHFSKIGATSFDFEAVYIVLTPDYTRYMDIQQDINLRLLEALEREDITFAYPTQRLWLENESRVRSELVPAGTADAAQTKQTSNSAAG